MRIIPHVALAIAFGGLTAFAAPASGQNPTTDTSARRDTTRRDTTYRADTTMRTDTTMRATTTMRTDSTMRTGTGRRRAGNRRATPARNASMQNGSMQVSGGSCASATAVANSYLADQAAAGHRLTMSRSAAVAQIASQTGSDGAFAGLHPCDAGYPNAVRFYLDEVIKAGTNNSTP